MLLLAGVSSSCQHKVPKPPVIQIHLHDLARDLAICGSSDGKPCDAIPMVETNNWLMLKPTEWQKIQDYNDLLICIIEGGCKEPQDGEKVDIKKAKYYVYRIKKTVYDLRLK